jgi:short-subunit dehydrogenase
MNIIVIGGTRGIGKELVIKLSEQKENRLIVAGRNQAVLSLLEKTYPNVKTCQLDISTIEKSAGIFRELVFKAFKDVDILINMAGLLIKRDFLNSNLTEARSIMETNFFGPAEVIRILHPLMKKGSHIVNITSMGGFQGSSKYRGLSYYSASKAALACLSECLAQEFSGSGISVNCLAIGAVQTEMFEEAFPGLSAQLNASEMAEFIAGFAINGNKYFNGKILPVAISNP